jgi:hypothetical protein
VDGHAAFPNVLNLAGDAGHTGQVVGYADTLPHTRRLTRIHYR